MIELKNSIDRNEISGKENPEKLVNIVEKIPNFNDQQRTSLLASCTWDLANKFLKDYQ